MNERTKNVNRQKNREIRDAKIPSFIFIVKENGILFEFFCYVHVRYWVNGSQSDGDDSSTPHHIVVPITSAEVTLVPVSVMGSTNTRLPLVGSPRRERRWGHQKKYDPHHYHLAEQRVSSEELKFEHYVHGKFCKSIERKKIPKHISFENLKFEHQLHTYCFDPWSKIEVNIRKRNS